MKDGIRDMVKTILTDEPKTRDDDFLLIAEVYRKYYDISSMDFLSVLDNHKELGLPSFESIRRSRQWLQAKFPLLYGASGEARKIRRAEFDVYREEFR